jgi:hypothetical protein
MVTMYLVDVDSQKREKEAVHRVLKIPFIAEQFFLSLGLNPYLSWYLLRIRQKRIVSSLLGDVDILAGKLSWKDPKEFESLVAAEAKDRPNIDPSWHFDFAARKLADLGGIKWPPATDYLVGIEAKCAYLLPHADSISKDTIKSQKLGKVHKIRKQIKSLLEMGFNKVALLDIIANPPASGPDGQAWLTALNIATRSEDEMSTVFSERLPANSPAGHWVWSIGSVIGGDESMRGAGAPVELRIAQENPFLQVNFEIQSRRHEMERNLSAILANLPSPRTFLTSFVDCETCRRIHRMDVVCNNT